MLIFLVIVAHTGRVRTNRPGRIRKRLQREHLLDQWGLIEGARGHGRPGSAKT